MNTKYFVVEFIVFLLHMFISFIPCEDKNDRLLFFRACQLQKKEKKRQKRIKLSPFKFFSSLKPTREDSLTYFLTSPCWGR